MVPPELMLTNKIPGSAQINGMWRLFWIIVGSLTLTACGPPGPRALIKGERLVREGKYADAVTQLERATQLLPKKAQAWNYLGLAYHANSQPLLAIRAYRQALTLDNKLSAARFNLGCLYLDQNDLPSAIEQLTSYTYVQPNAPEGWVKLGTAQLRANRLDLAERNYKAALEIQANNVEAFNGLGLIQFQKRRYADAFHTFQTALAHNPNYGPALLNAAIAAQYVPANRSTALHLYRQYLALQPKPDDFDKISAIANQLDAELNPVKTPPAVAAQTSASKSNTLAAVAGTNSQQRLTNATATAANPVVRTNLVVLGPKLPTTTATNPFLVTNVTAATASGPGNDSSIEVTRVESRLVIKPAQDLATGTVPALAPYVPPVATPTIHELETNDALRAALESQKPHKKGFLSRLFTGKSKPPSPPPTIIANVPEPSAPVVMNPRTTTYAPPVPQAPVVTRRYNYLSPRRPSAGNRPAADNYVAQGVQYQKAGLLSQAIAYYQRAIETDPACFSARYNLALAAEESGNWAVALSGCEYALAIIPDSVDARFRFARVLSKSGFSLDAVDQLNAILQSHPTDAHVHFWLAKVYDEELHQSQLAREHYQKVLQLQPAHKEAANIRYWLERNPPG